MRIGTWSGIACLLGIAGLAAGQSSVELYDVNKSLYLADLSTHPSIGVGNTYTVVLGSHEAMLFDKSVAVDPGNPLSLLDGRSWAPATTTPTAADYSSFPFQPIWSDPFQISSAWLTYPRADYDPITGSVWMVASESRRPNSSDTQPELVNQQCEDYVLHLGTTRAGDPVTSFDECLSSTQTNCWAYLTGANAIDVSSSFINRYFDGGDHDPFKDVPTHLSLGFDERAVMVAAMNPKECALVSDPDDRGQCVLILEREFPDSLGGTTTYHEGGEPEPTDMTMVRFNDLPYPDNVVHALAVQEPFDHEKAVPEFQNMQLFISTDGSGNLGAASINALRLRGLFWDDANGRWTMQQALEVDDPTGGPGGTPTYKHNDLEFDPSLEVFSSYINQTTPIQRSTFSPHVINEAFTSAVLANDWQGNPRVFAVHAAPIGDVEGQGQNYQWVVQWYVIDPDLANFHTVTPEDAWKPEVIEAGRISTDGASEPSIGDCYLPTIGVSRCGQAHIEYTFSNDTTPLEIRRATLSFNSDIVVSTDLVQAGPSADYQDSPDRWALHPDMQADPTSPRFWSTHTLVGGAGARDVWMFKKAYICFQLDMNLDGIVDSYDMALFTDYYLTQDPRADTNGDGVINPIDMANYLSAYDAGTSP